MVKQDPKSNKDEKNKVPFSIDQLPSFDQISLPDQQEIERRLAELEKGSPRLNWFYLISGVIIVSLLIYFSFRYLTRERIPQIPNRTIEEFRQQENHIQQLNQRLDALEERLKNLEERSN